MVQRLLRVSIVVCLVAGWVVGLVPNLAAQQGRPADQFYVVGFRSLPRDLAAAGQFHGATVERVDTVLHFARVSTGRPGDFVRRANGDPRVRFVEPDPEIKLIEFTPDDPRFGQQYGPQHIRAPQAWDTTLGDLDAKVCIVDSGVRYTHEDIVGTRWLGGTDVYNGDSNPMDDNGHGTHVTGIAAATIGNAKGIAGVANIGVYGVKVLSASGSGPWSTVASGIRWCADNTGPRTVISMSLGASAGATVLQDAVQYAYGKGDLLVAAAGNSGPCSNCVSYPAKYPEVIAVTCTDSNDAECSFSSDGPESELAAPGLSILSSWNTSDTAYNTISGTSMSTPHVSGAAALAWSAATGLSNGEVRQTLRNSAHDLGLPGWDEQYGYGLVDAKATLDAALAGPPPPEARVYFENFDDGLADGWTLTGLWHISSVCSTPPSVPNYLGYNEDSDCQYSTGARTTGSATVDVDLTGATSATLRFDHRFVKEVFTGGAYDVMRVQVSTNGGSTFTTLRQWDSRDSNQLAWNGQSVDLGPHAGRSVKVRFLFDSVDNIANNFAGWFLDNVEVTANVPGNQPPVANAGADQTVDDDDGSGDEAVTLDGTGSSDPDGTIVSYEWWEGSSLFATGPTPTVTVGVGSHTSTLRVTDDKGATATDDVVVTVNANRAPTASFTFTTSGLTVNVDGSGSSDPDGIITTYSWDWGDGTSAGSGATASHTYAAGGTYTVALRVTDNGGATGTTSKQVTVSAGETRVFFENFDDGVANGWTLSGLWHVSSVCSTPPSLPSYLGYNEDSDCQYSTGSRTAGNATFDVDLTGATQATLSFDHRFVKEVFTGGAYDILRVQVSTNGGSTWITLKHWDSRNANQLAWTTFTQDLDAYVGSPIKLRFLFDSLDGAANNYAGWFLDDVQVTAL